MEREGERGGERESKRDGALGTRYPEEFVGCTRGKRALAINGLCKIE